jgi:hypothetical protein
VELRFAATARRISTPVNTRTRVVIRLLLRLNPANAGYTATRMKPLPNIDRRFTSAISLATSRCCRATSALATAPVTSDEAEILYVPAAELQRALAELPRVSQPVVEALIMRRRRLRREREFAGLRVLAARSAFASNIEQQTSSIPDYAAGKGTTFFFLPTAISPFAAGSFPPTNLMARSTSCRLEFRPSLC